MFRTVGPPKPTKYASLICTLAMISAASGIFLGLATGNPLWIIFFLFPAVIYEIYRTQGVSTKWASWMMLLILIAEVFLIIFAVSFNLAEFLGQDAAYVGGQHIQLGDVKSLGPALLAVVSLVLMLRTAGVYTKWLAGIIFVTSFALIFALDPDIFAELLRSTIRQIMRRL
ncbi:MAG: hypothetical protein ACLFWD_01735 [Anaerolineales bacterium]